MQQNIKKTAALVLQISSLAVLVAAAVFLLIAPNKVLGGTQEYSSGSGSWSVPAGVTQVTVTMWAGGGSGGAGTVGATIGGGGGGGGVIYNWNYAVTPEGSVSYSVGTGGGAAGVGSNGTAGGNTTFGTLTANGGGAGIINGYYGGPGGAGGNATDGANTGTGGPGGPYSTTTAYPGTDGTSYNNGAGGYLYGGGGGTNGYGSPGGASYAAGTSYARAGGSSYSGGGGGGGSYAGFNGTNGGGGSGSYGYVSGAGGNGYITLTYTPHFTLTVTPAGTGAGTVTSSPAGIDCGSTCAADFNTGTEVTLSADPDSGSTFAGWSGSGCSGTGTCVVTVTAAANVTATFDPTYVLTITREGAGSGTVTSSPAGIDCGSTCSADFNSSTEVTLSAVPYGDSTFAGWSGSGCSGTGTCVVTMNPAKSVTATFSPDGTNIDSTSRYAWNDVIGWIDFYITGNVKLSASSLIGYASSSVGYIAFDCATSPNSPTGCSSTFSNWKVTNTAGILSGWAWNDQIGWISFNSSDTGICPGICYSVTYAGGDFSGWAWNDVIGWISFNCADSTCSPISYKVSTLGEGIPLQGSLTSSTFDTGSSAGVTFNTILYQTATPTSGTAVKFQFAASNNPDGNSPDEINPTSWAFSGYDGTDTTYYQPTAYNIPAALNSIYYNNKRYFKYKVFLFSDVYRSVGPQVDDVIVTWSR